MIAVRSWAKVSSSLRAVILGRDGECVLGYVYILHRSEIPGYLNLHLSHDILLVSSLRVFMYGDALIPQFVIFLFPFPLCSG